MVKLGVVTGLIFGCCWKLELRSDLPLRLRPFRFSGVSASDSSELKPRTEDFRLGLLLELRCVTSWLAGLDPAVLPPSVVLLLAPLLRLLPSLEPRCCCSSRSFFSFFKYTGRVFSVTGPGVKPRRFSSEKSSSSVNCIDAILDKTLGDGRVTEMT